MKPPVKAIKGKDEVLKQKDKAADDLFSTAVSKVSLQVKYNKKSE